MPGLSSPIRLIVGLGNPGEEYANTRHNAGAWFAEKVAHQFQLSFRRETKFKGLCSNFLFEDQKIHILIPDTFMNHSGQAVKLISDFFKILPENILIAHDELDLPVGDTRLKFAGGHGGHNGLRDIIAHLHTHDFYRLRIGIAHPGHKDGVLDYVLKNPSREDRKIIDETLEQSCSVLDYLLMGQNEKAMQLLHTKSVD
jgi:PTH1 family peptidyl-tRNA hydrolase